MTDTKEKSLEDKAKEYDWLEDYKGQTFSEPFEAEKWVYRRAIAELMERAEELQLPFLRMYKKIADDLIKEGK